MTSAFCVHIYCDGSCLTNPGPGGWAALLIWKPAADCASQHNKKANRKLLCGNEQDTTNNRMELTAAIEGLLALKRPCDVHLFCDSQYVVRGMNEWIGSWQKRHWKTAGGKPVENQDLWQKLLQASQPHNVVWSWVKAHAGNALNEYVDEQARAQAHLVSGSIRA
ncbi:MAG: ribonuclease HI [Myxococcota bacterium]